MGCYVNPQFESKESWLEKNGNPITLDEVMKIRGDLAGSGMDDGDDLVVCLVNNGFFTAAAVCYCYGEIEEFTRETDTRPKKYYLVSRDDLRQVSNLSDYEKR